MAERTLLKKSLHTFPMQDALRKPQRARDSNHLNCMAHSGGEYNIW